MRPAVLRWVVACVVAIGMIAQTAALVRHNGTMITQSFAGGSLVGAVSADTAVAALLADLKTAICHPGSGTNNSSGSGNSDPKPVSGTDCPVCGGLVCAYGLQAVDLHSLPADGCSIRIAFPPADQRVTRHRFLRPASRGPPAIV